MKARSIALLLCVSIVSFGQDSWTPKADLDGVARAHAFPVGNKIYVGTGAGDGFSALKDFWVYDTGLNTWTQVADVGGVFNSGMYKAAIR